MGCIKSTNNFDFTISKVNSPLLIQWCKVKVIKIASGRGIVMGCMKFTNNFYSTISKAKR